MHTHGVTQLRKLIGQLTDRRDFRRLHAGMHKRNDASLTPAGDHVGQITVKLPKDKVAVAIHQCDSGGS
jgi:hypothetical protein